MHSVSKAIVMFLQKTWGIRNAFKHGTFVVVDDVELNPHLSTSVEHALETSSDIGPPPEQADVWLRTPIDCWCCVAGETSSQQGKNPYCPHTYIMLAVRVD
jgi:hypothetical protein